MNRYVRHWAPTVFCLVIIFLATASPRVIYEADRILIHKTHTDAVMTSCFLSRDGRRHENVIRCSFDYGVDGKPYKGESIIWRSESPFFTGAGLNQELATQSLPTIRIATLSTYNAKVTLIRDDRWLAMPSLWGWESAIFIGLLGLIYAMLSEQTVDQCADPVRQRRLMIVQVVTVVLGVLAFLHSLSNGSQNALLKMSLTGFQELAARLVDCDHRGTGGRTGHDQINCGFEYVVDGKILHGQAESINFRLFPTDDRMNTEISKLTHVDNVTAYVDMKNPGYAVAFMSNEWWLTYSWGVGHLEIFIAMLVGLFFISSSAIKKMRRSL